MKLLNLVSSLKQHFNVLFILTDFELGYKISGHNMHDKMVAYALSHELHHNMWIDLFIWQ